MHNLRREDNFKFRLLTVKDVKSSYRLLSDVFNEMDSDGHKDYILLKEENEVKANIINNKVAGFFFYDSQTRQEKLVAEMSYKSIPLEEREDFIPNFKVSDSIVEDMDYIGSVCVDKNFRGLGLAKELNEFLEKESNKQYSVATVALTNYKSFGCFLGQGFKLIGNTIDPFDEANILILVKDKERDFYFQPPENENEGIWVSVDDDNYAEIMKEISDKKELVGYKFDKEKRAILFVQKNGLLKDLEIKKPIPVLGGQYTKTEGFSCSNLG